MILGLLRTVIGFALVLFLPGYLLSMIMFGRLGLPVRITLSAGLSMFIVVLDGFVLTIIGNITGIKAITPVGVIVSLGLMCMLFLGIYLFSLQKGIGHSGPDEKKRRMSRPKRIEIAPIGKMTQKSMIDKI